MSAVTIFKIGLIAMDSVFFSVGNLRQYTKELVAPRDHFRRYSATKERPKPQPMGLFWKPASTLLIPSQWFCIARTNLNLRNTI